MDTNTPIGVTNFRNQHIPFGIKAKDRTGHIYCIGKTGAGKSTLLLNMAIADMNNGDSVAIIDPHGDLADTILTYIPPKRINDVVYFDVSNTAQTVAYNPLQDIPDSEKYLVAAQLVLVFKKLWQDSWGARLEHILRNTIHTLTYYPEASLLDIQTLLTNYPFRKYVLSYVTEQSLLNFWHNEFEPLAPQVKAEHIASIVNKVGILSTHPILKAILSAKQNSINIEDIFNNKKIFIANLSKGSIGEAGASLLGSLLITSFQVQSLRRQHIPIAQRNNVYLYIDEIHSFMTDSFIDILSESRKYGICLFITHQYTEQIKPEILAGILGNVGTMISFRIGARDALLLEQEFAPRFSAEDLINLPRYSICIKLLIDGATSKPFSADTLGLRHTAYYCNEYIKELSIKRYYTEQQNDADLASILAPYRERINDADNIPQQQRLDFG